VGSRGGVKQKEICGTLKQFFQDERDRLSMSRLLCFLSFFPASVELFRIDNSDALGWYLGAFVAGYIGGKFGERKKEE
jgi:hypothetical protein